LPKVWFVYPETANVRLEDMNSIFGDATSVMPTPETLAEAEALFPAGGRSSSPIPSLDIRQQQQQQQRITADLAIPGLDIDPPSAAGGGRKNNPGGSGSGKAEGVGGWITNMINRTRGNGDEGSSGAYKRVEQDEEERG
jgi:hypothetical protein